MNTLRNWIRDRREERDAREWRYLRYKLRAEILPKRLPRCTFRFWAQDKLRPGQGSAYWWELLR